VELLDARLLGEVLDDALVRVHEAELVDDVLAEELHEYIRGTGIEVCHDKSKFIGIDVSTQERLDCIGVFFVEKFLCDDLCTDTIQQGHGTSGSCPF